MQRKQPGTHASGAALVNRLNHVLGRQPYRLQTIHLGSVMVTGLRKTYRARWHQRRAATGVAALIATGMSPRAMAQDTPPPPGRTRNLVVAQTPAAPLIDGKLDDTVWSTAPVAKDFWVSEYRRAPGDHTEVRVLMDNAALYFAFTCYDTKPEAIHAEQTKRDASMGYDDRVTVELDPYHNHRQVSEFSVNARGTQSDAIAGGRARKIEWKGDWKAAAQRTPNGWTAEIAIPFGILNYQPKANMFGVNFVRFHHRTQEYSRWADVTPQYLNEEAGHLTELKLPKRSLAKQLTVLHYGVAGLNAENKRGGVQDLLATSGLDIRHQLRNNLTSVLSLNPDFSQVEDDVLDLGFDYNEKFRADNRPFFQEGSAFYGKREYFYSGRVPTFDQGLKSFGKFGPTQIGALGVRTPTGRQDYVLRALRELGPTANAGLTFVGSDRGNLSNQTVVAEAGGRYKREWDLNTEFALTTTDGRPGDGLRQSARLKYLQPYWSASVAFQNTDKGFFPANGFIADDVLGTRGWSTSLGYGRQYGDGMFRSLEGYVSYGQRDTHTGLLQNRNLSAGVSAELQSNISIGLSTSRGPYRPRDDKPGTWEDKVNDDEYHSVGLYFDTRSDRRGYGLTYSWGNLGGGRYSDIQPSFWIKPTRRTYASYSFEHANSFGASTQQVLSLAWELSPEQSLSARWIGYDSGGFAGDYFRLAYRREVRKGIDVFAVYSREPLRKDRFTVKLVQSFSPF